MSTPAVIERSVPLYQLEEELMELLALAEEPELTAEEREIIDQQIAKYMTAEVRKVDGIAGTIRHCQNNAAIAKAEAERLGKIAAAWEARVQRIKENALRAMQAHGVKVLETPTNKLRVQGNGGLQPLEIYDESAIPSDCKVATLRMTAADFETLKPLLEPIGVTTLSRDIEVDGPLVRARLKTANVPGAKLGERGQHLRVE